MNTKKENRKNRFALSWLYFVMGLNFASWASRIPDVQSSLRLSDGELGMVLFAIPAGQLSMMAFSGFIVNRYGSKSCIVISLILYALGLCSLSAANSFWTLFAALTFFGAMANMLNIALNTQASNLEAMYERPIMSSFHGQWSLGGLAGGVIGSLIVMIEDTLWVHYAAVALLVVFAAMFFGRQLPQQETKTSANEKKMRLANIDRTIILLGIMAFGGMLCEGIVYDWSAVYFSSVVMPPAHLVRLGYIAGMAAMTLMRLVSDKLSARFGYKPVLQACGLLIIIGIWLAVIFPTLITATLGFLLVGMGISATVPICYSIAGKHPSLPTSIAITLVSSISFFGFLIGPPLIGLLAEMTSLRMALALASAFGLLIVIIPTTINYNNPKQ